MNSTVPVIPGDRITAQNLTFTVWSILYQDHLDDSYDVEFIDDQGKYHHWKECYDGGTVTRAGILGTYYRETSGAAGSYMIARIRPRRIGPGVSVTILKLHGTDIWLGSFLSEDAAIAAIQQYDSSLTWKKM